MSIARHHAEWLKLVDVSGPFLSLPVLMKRLPQGLDAHDPDLSRTLKLGHDAARLPLLRGRAGASASR